MTGSEDGARDERIGTRIALDLFDRRPSHALIVASDEASLGRVFSAAERRWKSLLAATSAGIAHADQDDPTVPDRELILAALQRLRFVLGSDVSSQAEADRIVFVTVETSGDPTGVVYAVSRSALDARAGALVVDCTSW